MNACLRNGTALLIVLGLGGCAPPEPPLLPAAPAAPAAIAPAQAPASNDDAAVADRPINVVPAPEVPVAPAAVEAAEELPAPAVVSVALDHAGEVVVGQRFSELENEGPWHAAGLAEATGGRCEVYERGSLPEGVSMMVEEGHVVRFELAPLDGSQDTISQPGPFGLRLGMPVAEALARLPGSATATPHARDPGAGEYLTWQDPGSDLAIRLEVFDGAISTLYWGASGAVELIEGCA